MTHLLLMALYKCIYRQTHMPGGLGYRLRNRVNLCHIYVRVLQLNNGLVLEFKIIFYNPDTSALVPKCPRSELSWVRSVLRPKCPGSEVSVHRVQSVLCLALSSSALNKWRKIEAVLLLRVANHHTLQNKHYPSKKLNQSMRIDNTYSFNFNTKEYLSRRRRLRCT